jgi:transcriptional regulator with XRE-family HTH domain
MPNVKKNGLDEYVKRVMKLKGLTQKDVQRLSGGKITDGYVASITTGRARNLSVDKIAALAEGLGVDTVELFHIACGTTAELDSTNKNVPSIDPLIILETVQKAIASPDVTEILNRVVRMSAEERRTLLRSLKKHGESDNKSAKSKRSRTT